MVVGLGFLLRLAHRLDDFLLAVLDPAVNDGAIRVGAVLGFVPIRSVAVVGEALETADATAVPSGFNGVIGACVPVVVLVGFAV